MKQKKILVADDDPHIVGLLKLLLQKAGYKVLPAFDGLDALEKAKKEKPDMVVLDIMMPGMDGYHVAYDLVYETAYQPTPKIVMLTCRGEKRDRELGLKIGVDSYITKPFEPRDLVKKLKEILGS